VRATSLSAAEEEALKEARKIPAIAVDKPAPYEFEGNPVFVCVDVECYELDHTIITEIGIATLDTLDLKDIPPGDGGEDWFNLIQARHFRIREYKHILNTRFVNGCADRFEFGESEFISKADAARMVMSCFEEPFCRKLSEAEITTISISSDLPSHTVQPKRNIIFVGHAPDGDLDSLRRLGAKPLDLPNLLETLDTAQLYRLFRREQNPKSIGSILYDLELTGWHLHNAGNDAVYTMWIMLGTCVRAAACRGTREAEEELKARQERELAERIAATKKKFEYDKGGWSSDGEDGDGPDKNDLPASKVDKGKCRNRPGSWQAKRAEKVLRGTGVGASGSWKRLGCGQRNGDEGGRSSDSGGVPLRRLSSSVSGTDVPVYGGT
jgi:hypothetical protein